MGPMSYLYLFPGLSRVACSGGRTAQALGRLWRYGSGNLQLDTLCCWECLAFPAREVEWMSAWTQKPSTAESVQLFASQGKDTITFRTFRNQLRSDRLDIAIGAHKQGDYLHLGVLRSYCNVLVSNPHNFIQRRGLGLLQRCFKFQPNVVNQPTGVLSVDTSRLWIPYLSRIWYTRFRNVLQDFPPFRRPSRARTNVGYIFEGTLKDRFRGIISAHRIYIKTRKCENWISDLYYLHRPSIMLSCVIFHVFERSSTGAMIVYIWGRVLIF